MESIVDILFGPYETYSWIQIALEATGVALGLASVFFALYGNILVYPTGIISTGIFVFLLYQFGLYGDMGINAYYFAMSIYGWYNWSKGNSAENELPISWAGNKNNLIGVLILLVSFPLFSLFLEYQTDSTVPWIDGFTTSIFLVGMWFMANKQVENWIYWIIGDLISIPLYHYKGLTLTAIQYVVFLGMAIVGFFVWMREAKTKNEVSYN
ncbi:MAG: nicotinamide riboside transporter PnuC [Bacteroidia bacterium]|nr:nicotinamide riboside transporter PnuC [Bacteroidia bacterium]